MTPVFPELHNKNICCLFAGIFCLFLTLNGCSKPEAQPPWVNIGGYEAQLVYHEPFSEEISGWHIEGSGEAALTQAGELKLLAYQEGDGVVLWAPIELSDSFQLEYEVHISDSSGTNSVLICALDAQGEDPLNTASSRTGKLHDYTHGPLRNYMITYNVMDAEGAPRNQSRLRKNPQYLLLSHTDNDPCLQGNRHLIDVAKMSNRIQFYVDGKLIHDVRDKGGFDAPVYMEGHLGFRIEPLNTDASVSFHRVKLYHLNPI